MKKEMIIMIIMKTIIILLMFVVMMIIRIMIKIIKNNDESVYGSKNKSKYNSTNNYDSIFTGDSFPH